MTAVITVDALTKTYGKARGIEDVTFDVRKGEVFGFLGPNGAGKTTTIRCMLDLLRPTAGRIEILGMDPRADAPRIATRVGYVSGEPGFPERLTAREVLRYSANLRGNVDLARVESLSARLQLDVDRRVREMSNGNKRKVSIVQAFMHEPDLLFLDEPTSGLDPLMQQEFNALVREAKAEGRTIFLSSHVLSEVDALCDRVAIIREGRLVAVEEMGRLKERAVHHARAKFASPKTPAALAGVEGVSDVRADDDGLIFVVRGPAGALLKALAALDVTDLTLHEPTLEEAFLGYYARPEGANTR
ncbi:MAG: ABC transporter ATP-binding protein [Candidatus Thermoplasmatota archaeon]